MTAPAQVAARWRVERITIRHFRGVEGERTYAFDGRPGLLHGHNGVGKSTVALGLQWILFGKFQPGVLANAQSASFLAPVQGKGKGYSGEVVFARGEERLALARDGAQKAFTVRLGNEAWTGAEAEARRDELLGLDMDTFVRAVLLQQSCLRGLLLDEPKERNKALDRLLGMDALEHLFDAAGPLAFTKAAAAWREAIRAEQQALEANERLLQEQLEAAQRTARELKFLSKDLTPAGLDARYGEVSRDLAALGQKYDVPVAPLPPCPAPARAGAAAAAFGKGLKALRLGAAPQRKLAPVQQAIAALTAARGGFADAADARAAAVARLAALAAKHGEPKAIEGRRAEARERIVALRRALKDADDLRQLLCDAQAHVARARPGDCPVCEQALPDRDGLAASLGRRAAAMATEGVERLERQVAVEEARAAQAEATLAEVAGAAREIEAAAKACDRAAERAAAALGGPVPGNKLLARLGEALAGREAEREKLARAVEELEADLEALELRQRNVQGVLLPAVVKRDELARHEERREGAKRRHAAREAKAAAMEARAAQLEAIRKALLAAKEDLARDLLDRAAPRAQALYRKLVRQPVFETLDVQVNAKAAKVDYAFQVATAGGAARDARLVLSDGQLTATALALFFGLAESTAHALDLLYVDDPTQNLDLPCKEAMAKVVADMARRRQVIVSTQDEDFVTFLQSAGFPAGAVVHHLSRWDGNPTVETSLPGAGP